MGKFSSSLFSLGVNERSQPHPWPLHKARLCNRSKWKNLWKSIRTYLPHLSECLYILRSSIELSYLLECLFLMGQCIATHSCKIRKSSSRSKIYSTKGTFDQDPHHVEAQSCSYRRNMRLGKFILITEL
jgi:hypothetical protein